MPKFKHGIHFVLCVFFFFASTCMLGIWEIICIVEVANVNQPGVR